MVAGLNMPPATALGPLHVPVASGVPFKAANNDVAGLLKPGTNVIAVLAENGGDAPNPAGLIAALQVRFASGANLEVASDATWQAAMRAGQNWQTLRDGQGDWSAGDDARWIWIPPVLRLQLPEFPR